MQIHIRSEAEHSDVAASFNMANVYHDQGQYE
jgi:hypothetical protein